jgi:thymidylate synthase
MSYLLQNLLIAAEGGFSERMNGNIPVLHVRGNSLAEAWEKSLLELYEHGARIRTEYDKASSPPSFDATMIVEINDPMGEPRIHRSFPAGLDFLEEYRQEVVDGIKDHWIRDKNDPTDTRWEYTYHERLFNYSFLNGRGEQRSIDQIAYVVEKLASAPHTRRAQAITWKVWEDLNIDDPACMQSLWFRIVPNDEDTWVLNMNVRFRSNDAYEAAFMNMFALTSLQESVARRLEAHAGRTVSLGRYVHIADSYHIYGSRLADFEQRFLAQVRTRSFADRTWTTEMAQPFFDEAKPLIRQKVEQETEKLLRKIGRML